MFTNIYCGFCGLLCDTIIAIKKPYTIKNEIIRNFVQDITDWLLIEAMNPNRFK